MLELRELSCERGGRAVVRNVSVRLEPGRLLRVEGANGSGKTSLLRTICGLLAPSTGSVWWRGRPITQEREQYHRQLIYLGHAAALKDDLSALENLLASAALAGVAVERELARAALAAAGLRGREHVAVRHLSQGQRKRAALARLALAGTQALWVLDEPFDALDRSATAWLLGLIESHLDGGGSLVLTSHQSVGLGPDLSQATLAL